MKIVLSHFVIALIAVLSVINHTPSAELYSDEWVKGMARVDVDVPYKSIFDAPLLDVVKAGESSPIHLIFTRLGLSPERLIPIPSKNFNHVEFFFWKISASYGLLIMTATNELGNETKPLLQRNGYGVRVYRLADGGP